MYSFILYIYIYVHYKKHISVCIYYEGTLQISAIALNVIPSGNKVYLI